MLITLFLTYTKVPFLCIPLETGKLFSDGIAAFATLDFHLETRLFKRVHKRVQYNFILSYFHFRVLL